MQSQYQQFTRLLALSLTFAVLLQGGAADLPNINRAAATNSLTAGTNASSSSNRMAELRRRIRQERLTNGVANPTNGIGSAAVTNADPFGPNANSLTNKALAGTNKVAGPLPLPSPLPLSGANVTNAVVLAPGATIPTNRTTVLPGGVPGRAGTNRSGLTNLAGPRLQSPNLAPVTNVVAETNKPPMVTSGADDIIESVDLQLDNMPIAQFLDVYGTLSHRTIIRANTLPAQNLTLTAQTALTRKEAIEAMDGVLAQNGITMIPVGEKFVKAVPALTAQQEGAPISESNAKDLPEADQFVTRIVKLKAAKAMDVAPLFATFSKSPTAVTPIESNNTLILRDYAANVKRMLDIIQRVDVTPESDFKLEVVNIKYGKVEDIYATMSALISGSGGGGGAGAIPGAGAAQRQSGGNRGGGGLRNGSQGFGGGFGNSGYGGGGYGNNGGFNNIGGNRYGGSVYPQSEGIVRMPAKTDSSMDYYPQQAAARPVGAGSVAGNAGSFQNRLNNVVRGAGGQQSPGEQVLESANIVPDYRSNRLLIYANKHDMEMITNLVSKVDTLLAQVLIEAIIMEVEIGDSQTVGVTMASSRRIAGGLRGTAVSNPTGGGAFLNAITNLPSGGGSGFNYFGQVGNDLDFVVNAIAESSTTKVVSRPRIQTSHAIPGSFFLGQTVPYVTGATDYGGYGVGLASRSTVSQASVGFSLNVVPFITPEGLVVMDISQTFDTLGRDVIIDSNPIPVINNRTADATLTVRSGDVIMMGGFIHDQRQQSNSGIPFLKDIPGIGALFRSKSHNNDRTELIVLMRATVL
ncbi:MAG: hypothetical protein JWM99_1352, partial [Verrucomicrobiales bacterium]|nr:hypothetical protein [Verrucomicrobiales bacterium]